jgi:predicted DNA-binding transcriptional regulator AlpA
MNKLNFEDLPDAVTQLTQEVSALKKLLLQQVKVVQADDEWLDLDGLVQYDPEKRSKATFYGYIHRRTIPFHKKSKKLLFLKSEIDTWLKEGRRKTLTEIENDAGENLIIRRTGS